MKKQIPIRIPKFIVELKTSLEQFELTDWALNELKEFIDVIKNIKTDDETHYSHSYKNFNDALSDHMHNKLMLHDFINGEPEENTWEKRPKVCFWWVLRTHDPMYYRPYSDHHASSKQRQVQALNMLNDIISTIESVPKIG